jgi:hypothetical protein
MSAGTSPEENDAIMSFSAYEGDAVEEVLPFEVWSETSARLTRMDADRTAQILAAEEVLPSRWELSEMRWIHALAADLAEGKMERATSHGQRCAEEMSRRRERADQTSKSEFVDATAEMTALRDEPALPFGAPQAAGFNAGRGAAFAATLRASFRAPMPRGPRVGETLEVPALPNSIGSAVPFLDPEHAFERWTTKQYASLCAELSVFQEHSCDVLARYHLKDDAARRRLDEEWKRRVASDPALGLEIQKQYAAYRAYLVKA